MTITHQVKHVIQEGLAQLRPVSIPTQSIETEPENKIELITQESQPINEDITKMNLDKEPRKRKEYSTQNAIDGPSFITPTRSSIQ